MLADVRNASIAANVSEKLRKVQVPLSGQTSSQHFCAILHYVVALCGGARVASLRRKGPQGRLS